MSTRTYAAYLRRIRNALLKCMMSFRNILQQNCLEMGGRDEKMRGCALHISKPQKKIQVFIGFHSFPSSWKLKTWRLGNMVDFFLNTKKCT
jgi:hypothetical protein